jgi:RNA polymerase sigma-70 factor (ECF subfamily)
VTDFASIYRNYRRRIYFQCFCMLHDPTDAEDATQEVFLQLFRKVHTFRGESSFSTWLHRLTTNCVLMEIRRRRHRFHETVPREISMNAGMGNAVMDAALDTIQAPSTPTLERISIVNALSQLPKGYQRIFELHDVQGYTHEEIGKLLGIKGGTSKSQLHRARLRMRRLLQTSSEGAKNPHLTWGKVTHSTNC